MARELLANPSYRAKLEQRLASGDIAPAMECALWCYAYGKPKDTVQVDLPTTLARMSTADLKKHTLALLAKL